MNDIFLTIPADKLLALTAYGEAASEGTEGMMAVINVVLNRMKDLTQFGDSSILAQTGSAYHAVVLKAKQFSVFNASDPGRSRLESLAASFNSAVLTNKVLANAYDIAKMAIQGMLSDNTGGSTHYHATSVMPSWASTIPLIGQIGNHIFYSVYPAYARVRQVTSVAIETLKPYTTYIIIALVAAGGLLILRRRS